MLNKKCPLAVLALSVCAFISGGESVAQNVRSSQGAPAEAALPPRLEGSVSLDAALRQRKSTRVFSGKALTLTEVSQLLWAAQGMTGIGSHRTVPSAGALYPLETYLAASNVDKLPAGVYHYELKTHRLRLVVPGDRSGELSAASYGQRWMRDAAAMLVIAADPQRTAAKYRERAARYVPMEAGHAAQNVYLEAAAMGLGTAEVGAFDDREVKRILALPAAEEPLAIMPVGWP